jgi:moderate conductance mechanosensitive channel
MDVFTLPGPYLHSIADWLESIWRPLLFLFIIIVFTQLLGKRIIRSFVHNIVRNNPFNPMDEGDLAKRRDTLISLFDVILKVIVYATAIMTVIRLFIPQFDASTLIAGAGVAGVALGFGAQSLVKDFLTGMFIILENQYRVGDIVDLSGAAGTVERITIRSTVIRDNDGNVHYVPNGTVAHVINKTMDYSRVNIKITVDARTDVDELTRVINTVGKKLARDPDWKSSIFEAPAFASVGSFGDKEMEIIVSGKTHASAQWKVTSEMKRRLYSALTRHHIDVSQL